MPINPFDTAILLASIEAQPPVHSFLRDRYFPTGNIFLTEKVFVEYKDGNKKIAPFVSPRVNGVTMTRDGSTLREFQPAHIAPKRVLTADDLQKRGFGEALFGNLTPEQRALAITTQDMIELQKMINIREEKMAADVIFTNKLTMQEYGTDPEHPVEKEVRFYTEATNPAQYTISAANKWDTSAAKGQQIINDLHAMIKILTKRGLSATEAICSPDVADVIINNEYIQKLLDNRRIEMGGINPEELPAGVVKVARLNVKGHLIDILSYDEEYTDLDGTTKAFVPAKTLAVGAANAGQTVYGAITQLEDDKQFHTYAGTSVPKVEASGNVRSVILSSAPLTIPTNKNPFVVAQPLA